jgi:hypothetical protein
MLHPTLLQDFAGLGMGTKDAPLIWINEGMPIAFIFCEIWDQLYLPF